MEGDISGVGCALAARCAVCAVSVHDAQEEAAGGYGWRVTGHQSAPNSQRTPVGGCHVPPLVISASCHLWAGIPQFYHHHHQGLDHGFGALAK